jgi:hypothetical protein
MTSYVPFDRVVDESAKCEGCRRSAILSGPQGEEPAIAYALNSLLDRALDQDVVEQVLALRWAERAFGVVWAVPGADVLPAGGRKREVDVLAMSRAEFIVGEVKASSRSFDLPVVRDIARLAKDLGADRLVLASGDDWDPGARDAAMEAASKMGLAVTTVSGSELRTGNVNPIWPHRDDPKWPHPRPMS